MLPAGGCRQSDPALRILAHRHEFKVKISSWRPTEVGVLVEFEILAAFEARIETLTVRLVGFDEQGRETDARRVPLPLQGIVVGLPFSLRREVDLKLPAASLGVEIESQPPRSVWCEIPELAGIATSSESSP